MFSEVIDPIERNIPFFTSKNVDIDNIQKKIESGKTLSLQNSQLLLNVEPNDDVYSFQKILEMSGKIKRNFFCGEIYPLVPLYVSSICQENCVYCNYRIGNKNKKIERLRLSNEELAREVEFLAKKGFRVIELVYASDPFITTDDISDHIEITHSILSDFGGGMVGINARPYSIKEYKKLKKSGLCFAVLWQETYDKVHYKELHPGNTEKTDFSYRLNAPDRMAEAGIENIGLGVLSGLSDWRNDWYMLMNHVDYLLKQYEGKINTVILGIPRLKPATGALLKETAFIPDDSEYLLAISVFNLFLPTALPFVNTRESWDTCVEIAKGGGTLFTLSCKTIPGGYALGRVGCQFPTYDFSGDGYDRKLKEIGLSPIFDWNFTNFNWKTNLVRNFRL